MLYGGTGPSGGLNGGLIRGANSDGPMTRRAGGGIGGPHGGHGSPIGDPPWALLVMMCCIVGPTGGRTWGSTGDLAADPIADPIGGLSMGGPTGGPTGGLTGGEMRNG